MKVRVWTYLVPPELTVEFEREYGAGGSWDELFARSDGYRGTQLFRAVDEAGQYLTVDRFASQEAWDRLRAENDDDYVRLGARLEHLTVSQEELL